MINEYRCSANIKPMEEIIMNEQSKKLETIRNRCRTSSKILAVLQIMTIVGAVLALIGAIVCFTQKSMLNEHLSKAVESGLMRIESLKMGGEHIYFLMDFEKNLAAGEYALLMAFSCLAGVILCVIVAFALGLFQNIFKNLSTETTPFSDKILGKLKVSFIVLIVALFTFAGIGPAVLGALLMWCIYSILEYGKALQSEVDEIL